MVVLVGNYSKIWTICGINNEWVQCHYYIELQSTMCKHIMKVFLMKHLDIDEGMVLREAETRCRIERTIPMVDAF